MQNDEDEDELFFDGGDVNGLEDDPEDESEDGSLDPTLHGDGSYRLPILRPLKRSECASIPRPCPFVSCRYHLYLDVRDDGGVRLNFPDREPHEMTASCSLDLASDGPRTLDLVGALMGFSKERARQLEASGLKKVKQLFVKGGTNDLDD